MGQVARRVVLDHGDVAGRGHHLGEDGGGVVLGDGLGDGGAQLLLGDAEHGVQGDHGRDVRAVQKDYLVGGVAGDGELEGGHDAPAGARGFLALVGERALPGKILHARPVRGGRVDPLDAHGHGERGVRADAFLDGRAPVHGGHGGRLGAGGKIDEAADTGRA